MINFFQIFILVIECYLLFILIAFHEILQKTSHNHPAGPLPRLAKTPRHRYRPKFHVHTLDVVHERTREKAPIVPLHQTQTLPPDPPQKIQVPHTALPSARGRQLELAIEIEHKHGRRRQ